MDPKSPLHHNFSKAMGYYKSLLGKSNKDIAEALNIPTTTISAWNTGRHLPDMERLQLLADYLQAPISQFFKFTALQTDEEKELQELIISIKNDPTLYQLLISSYKLSDEDKEILKIVADRMNK